MDEAGVYDGYWSQPPGGDQDGLASLCGNCPVVHFYCAVKGTDMTQIVQGQTMHEAAVLLSHCSNSFGRILQIILINESMLYLSGFGERLLTEVKKLAPKDVKIKVSYLCGWTNRCSHDVY